MFENKKYDACGLDRWRHTSRLCLVTLIFISTSTGCHSAMPTSYSAKDDGTIVRNTFPLKFKRHNFGAYCFNTIGCKIFYGDAYGAYKDDDEVSPPPPPPPVLLKRMSASRSAVENFPPPAVVTWRSLDGVPHEAHVDIGEIFKDQRVLHNVPEQDIPIETVAVALPGPDIILIVDDRTISVYMKAMVFLKKPRTPSNPLTNFVEEPILAYRHVY